MFCLLFSPNQNLSVFWRTSIFLWVSQVEVSFLSHPKAWKYHPCCWMLLTCTFSTTFLKSQLTWVNTSNYAALSSSWLNLSSIAFQVCISLNNVSLKILKHWLSFYHCSAGCFNVHIDNPSKPLRGFDLLSSNDLFHWPTPSMFIP